MNPLNTSLRLPRRTESHKTDTLAVRKVFTKLPAEWVIRDLSERDYGIDLMLEHFTTDSPTGKIVFFQVKGSRDTIKIKNSMVKFQLDKKTLAYAEIFPEPFFLIVTSIKPNEPVYFVWLQKYISQFLDIERPEWRNESTESICVSFSESNNFESGYNKLVSISEEFLFTKQALQFLSEHLFWECDFAELVAGNFDFKAVCLARIREFRKLDLVFSRYDHFKKCPNFKEIIDCVDAFDIIDEKDRSGMISFDEHLEFIKTQILTSHQQEIFVAENTGDTAY